ncbi:MAG: hypothetical protein WDZ35_14295 [Crocinitomicaceae bacterium]
MRKYKVNRKKPVKLPSKEAIEKYKDFPRLRHEYDRYVKRPKKPLYKDKKLFFFILMIALLAYLIAQAIQEEEEEKNKDKGDNTEVLVE